MSENLCVCCGAVIPEGRQVCASCISKRKKNMDMVYKAQAYSKSGSIYRTSGNQDGVIAWVDKMMLRDDVYMAEMQVMK